MTYWKHIFQIKFAKMNEWNQNWKPDVHRTNILQKVSYALNQSTGFILELYDKDV